jgi:hypothetical protein
MMIRTLTLLAFAFCATAGAATWDDLAARFGCTAKAHASEQAGGTQYIMEFIPQGQKLGKQERMFTVTMVRTSMVDAEANQHADQVAKSMAGVVGRSGAKVIEFSGARGNHGPVAFFEFVIKDEYNIGVIQRSGPGIIAIQQLATFAGRTPTADDRAKVRALVGLK